MRPRPRRVLKRPLLIVPPWINKFYVLDLTPEKSFIKWCVDQGLTVFCISWVNPDAAPRAEELRGLRARRPARRARRDQAGDRRGQGPHRRLLRRRHAAGDRRSRPWRRGATSASLSATLFAAQVDFTYAGDLKVFVDEEQVAALERRMAERGYLEGKSMATVFNMLRSNDLVWPYVINNYLKGKAPFPFDLLYWNSDATRHAGRQPFVLSAQLLSRQQACQGQDDDRRHADRSRSDQGADLQSGDARGPHRAGEIGAARLADSSAAR